MLLNITSQNKFDIYVDDPKYILIRLYEVTKTTKPQELAEILHTDISAISTLMEENRIPMYCLMVLHATNNVSPMWILFGIGDIYYKDCYFDALGLHSAWVG